MARKNRKKNVTGGGFPAVFAGVAVLIVLVALIYVWLGCLCDSVGSEIAELESERGGLFKKYLNEEFRWTELKSPRSIEMALARHRVIMRWPAGGQVVKLPDIPVSSEYPGEEGDGAQRYARYSHAGVR